MVLGDLQVIIGVTIFLHWGARVMNWGVDKLGGGRGILGMDGECRVYCLGEHWLEKIT